MDPWDQNLFNLKPRAVTLSILAGHKSLSNSNHSDNVNKRLEKELESISIGFIKTWAWNLFERLSMENNELLMQFGQETDGFLMSYSRNGKNISYLWFSDLILLETVAEWYLINQSSNPMVNPLLLAISLSCNS